MLIINDLHIGVNRAGGTTPQSQAALREYLREGLTTLLDGEEEIVVVNGDLFDSFDVGNFEVIKTAKIFFDWLDRNKNGSLCFIAGNHDWQPKAEKVSSFNTLCYMLQFSGRSTWFGTVGFSHVYENVSCIAHMPNQEMFNAEIAKAAEFNGKGRYLLLHCNYKNGFAENSDHSLNLSDEQVGALMESGWTLVLGHEHIGRTFRGERVIIVGNQFPSSIADCIGDEDKHCLRIVEGRVHFERTWSSYENYIEVNWRLLPVSDKYRFIRVTGNATAAESAEVIRVISKLRQTHPAFVIGNAVKIEGCDLNDEIASSVEDIAVFDVAAAIMGELTEEERAVVKGLLE